MEMRIERRWKKAGYTIGRLYVDGTYVCETLEDTDRGLRQDMAETALRSRKVAGRTAVPTGRYAVVRTWSPRFKRALPLLVGVPCFSGIRIHSGNTASDTEGCILVGRNTRVGMVLESRKWLGVVDGRVEAALEGGGSVWVTIE